MIPAGNPLQSLPTRVCANAAQFSIPSRGPQQSAQLKPREAVSREFGQFESAKVRAGALSLMAGPLLGSLRNVNPARIYSNRVFFGGFGSAPKPLNVFTRSTGKRGDIDRSSIHLARFVSPDSASRRGVEPLAPPKAHGFPSQSITPSTPAGGEGG